MLQTKLDLRKDVTRSVVFILTDSAIFYDRKRSYIFALDRNCVASFYVVDVLYTNVH